MNIVECIGIKKAPRWQGILSFSFFNLCKLIHVHARQEPVVPVKHLVAI